MNDNDRQYTCPRCGGTIEGDGYITVRHCENADDRDLWDREPDSPIVLCKKGDNGNTKRPIFKTNI